MFKKNPDYWDAKNIHIDAVELTSAPDASTVVNGLRTGVYNFADIEPSQAEAAKKAGLDVFVQPGFNAANISLNVNKAPFDNPKVVDAVRHAVNRKEFVDKLTFGYGEETDQPFPKDYVAYDPKSENAYPYDPAKSKKLLAQAGYRPHQLKLNLVIPSEDPQAEIVQSQLAAVGIDVTIKIDKNWATPFFAKDLTFSLQHHRPRLRAPDAHRPLRPERPAEPQLALPARLRGRRGQGAPHPAGLPEYPEVLQAATRAGLESRALVFTFSQPNLIAKSPSISGLPKVPAHITWTGVTIDGR